MIALLAGTVVALAWTLGGGPRGPLYLVCFGAATLPGLPAGFALFGRRHAAGWISGALIGYAVTSVVLWAPVQLDVVRPAAFAIAWTVVTAGSWSFLARQRTEPGVLLPRWTQRDTLALTLVLLLVPLLLWKPLTHIGSTDAEGSRRYRAYFTADFLWHVALTSELARLQAPPRNPYLVRRPLNYYWAYFVPPAVMSRAGVAPSVQSALTVNALCAGLLFVSAIFVAAWCAVPRAGAAAIATSVALVAASAEGLHAAMSILQRGGSLAELRHLNIDAITAWYLRGLTIDGLPRSLWYTPQHASACALSLVALMTLTGSAPLTRRTSAFAGVALGLALIFSPFLGGAFCLIFGAGALWMALRSSGRGVAAVLTPALAALPVLAALAWCIGSGTFEGARGAVAIGPSRMAAAAPFAGPALALGPLLALALPALMLNRGAFRLQPAIAGLAVGFAMYYLVSLTSEPIWIGWRAGQILLVTLPALAAATLSVLSDSRRRWLAVLLVAAAAIAGIPTTAIDTYNAQDVSNTAMGPGFRWTVVVRPDSQAALDWIRTRTPPGAVVQMAIGPRGRETWTLVPTFGQRRMAAGRPISLLAMPDYDRLSDEADAIFATADAAEAAQRARQLRIDYVYLDRVEREAFGAAAAEKFDDARYFRLAFRQDSAAVYAVR